jgi:Flp pilus assembly protein TadG
MRPTRETDRGSTTLTTVMLTPVFVVIAFAAFQASMWTHARTEARAVARDAAALVARNGQDPTTVEASAEATLQAGADLGQPDVEITAQGQLVVVRVTGRAPGIIRGTSRPIEVVEAMPIEGFRP